MPSIDVTSGNIGTAINKVLKAQEEMFKDSLIHVLNYYFVDDYINQFSIAYDQMLIAPFEAGIDPNDLTAPSKLKADVISFVAQEVRSKISTLRSNSRTMSVSAIEHSVFGFPSGPPKTSKDSLKLFYFYLVGTPKEFAFVSVDFIDEWRVARSKIDFPSGPRRTGSPMGRFDMGFMVPLDEYKAVYQVSKKLPSPGSARHPFSGAPPIRIFEDVQKRVNFNIYIEKAVALMRKS